MNKLREARSIRGLRQIELENETSIRCFRISQIENHLVKPREDEKARLAQALRMKVKELFPK